jgi:acyl-coenzyme A thioesterase PaaI-like protein
MNLYEFLGAEPTDGGLRAEFSREVYGAYDGAFGGIVAAFALAAGRREAPGRRPLALDARFLTPVKAGTVHAEPRVVRAGRTLTVVDVSVRDANGELGATATLSFVDTTLLHELDDAAMVRPGASIAHAEASPFQLRRRDVPIVGTLGPRVALTSADLVATALLVPWEQEHTGPEAACLAADLSVGPSVERELEGEWVPHPNPDLSLRFCGEDAGPEVAGVTRLERVSSGVAAVRIEVFSGIDLIAVGCSSSLLLGRGDQTTTA